MNATPFIHEAALKSYLSKYVNCLTGANGQIDAKKITFYTIVMSDLKAKNFREQDPLRTYCDAFHGMTREKHNAKALAPLVAAFPEMARLALNIWVKASDKYDGATDEFSHSHAASYDSSSDLIRSMLARHEANNLLAEMGN